jgi:hypothetical protein
MTGSPPHPVTRADILNELAKIAFADVSQDGPDRVASSPAASRMRRHRERRRDGLRCLRIKLRATEIEALIDKGLLKPETRNDAKSIIEALYAFFDKTLS